MKRGWLVWIVAVVFSVAMIFLLHAVRVLPLAPAPPYKNGDGVMVTPTNPWTR